jgi:hypothetical protein
VWSGRAGGIEAGPVRVLALAGEAIGPLAVVAALAGLATAAVRGRFAAAALLAAAAGTFVVDVRVGAIVVATPIVGGLATGLGLARLAALVRHPAGQTCLGAAGGFMLLAAPVWALAVG